MSLEHTEEGFISYQETTHNFKLARQTLPPPYKSLTNAQEVRWRQLETNTVPSLIRMQHINPDKYKADCYKCGQEAGTEDTFWDCPVNPPLEFQKLVDSQWETLLASSDPKVQVQVTA